MKKRIKNDIWKGMYDFYLLDNKQRLVLEEIDDPLFVLAKKHNLAVTTSEKEERHLLTHQDLFVKFHKIDLTRNFVEEAKYLFEESVLVLFNYLEIENLPKPILIQNFLKKLNAC